MVSKSHAPKKASSSRKPPTAKAATAKAARATSARAATAKASTAKTPAVKATGIKTKAPVKEKASALAARTSNVKAKTKKAAASAPKTPIITSQEPAPYHFRTPLPTGFDTKMLENEAEGAKGERKTKIRVMASLYSGHDYGQAADENHVPLGSVYLWLADFRRGGLAAL